MLASGKESTERMESLVRFDRSYQVPTRSSHRRPYCRLSNGETPHTVTLRPWNVREIVVRFVLKNFEAGIVGRLEVLVIERDSRRLEFRLEES
jgi:hypothetical protein